MAWIVDEDGLDPVTCATLTDARSHVEDRAAEVWDRLVDPNAPRRVFPDVRWDIVDRDNAPVVTATMDLPEGSSTKECKEWEIRHVRD